MNSPFCAALGISQETWKLLESKMQRRTVKSKEILLQDGDTCRNLIFLKKGAVRSYYTENGKEFIDQFFFEGEIVANFQSFLGQTASETSIEVVEDSVIYILPYHALQTLQQQNSLQEIYLKIACMVIDRVKKRFCSMLVNSPVERYTQLQQNNPEILYRVPQYMVASYLGITPETLSRIRKRLSTRRRSAVRA